MQTNFSLAALAAPGMQEAEKILRTCVHCGFCTATCPTYLELGDELDSPRGRIYLIKTMFETGAPASEEVATHIDRCLSCLSCMTTCPSGVDYMHLVDKARAHVQATYWRPWYQRLPRYLLAQLLPYPARLAAVMPLARLARPLAPLMKKIPQIGNTLAAMLTLAPKKAPPKATFKGPALLIPRGEKRGRVALLSGCAQKTLAPNINDAAIRVLALLGYEVVLPRGEGCCGALVHHMGEETTARDQARRLVNALWDEHEDSPLDAVIITASGCGTSIKDYGHLLQDDQAYASRAASISGLAKDISEFLAQQDLKPAIPTGQVVAYHSACSMQHGQKIIDAPKNVLKALGFVVRDVPEGHICCGSAGTYNMLQSEISSRLRTRKTGNIARLKPAIVATGNLGCISQIALGFDERGETTPVVHTIELVEWALGGEKPHGLS
jgi:glycolate oxidase iron-sulfur subunit